MLQLDQSANLNRDGQGQMFQSSDLKTIVIFAEKRNQQEASKLKEMISTVFG